MQTHNDTNMAFLTTAELATHINIEIVNEISRNDNTKLQDAIDAGIDEAKSYLSDYDVATVFAATGNARNKILLLFVKDIAVWHYIQLANPNIDMQLRLDRYEKAIAWLKMVQKGNAVPNLPIAPIPDGASEANNFITYGSKEKRELNY
jgi:phage gp36-like protein